MEADQLRGLNLEQQRALRHAERTKEELQVSEKVLREEVKKMKELLEKEKSALTTMQVRMIFLKQIKSVDKTIIVFDDFVSRLSSSVSHS